MKPNISRVLVGLVGFCYAQPNLHFFDVSGVSSVNQIHHSLSTIH
jgi:hypothetical protein